MPAPIRSKEDVMAELLQVLRETGYDGATLSRFTEVTGLGKASLYNYFPGGKEEIAKTILELVSDWMEANVLADLRSEGDGEAKISRMVKTLDEFYRGGKEACILCAFTLGDGRNLFSRQVKKIFAVWIDELARLLVERGIAEEEGRRRAEDALVTLQGAVVMSRAMKDGRIFERAMESIRQELTTP
jgi:TetR/AcrR family transcriptional regulator, lmrAB and yxaGH operons repressor